MYELLTQLSVIETPNYTHNVCCSLGLASQRYIIISYNMHLVIIVVQKHIFTSTLISQKVDICSNKSVASVAIHYFISGVIFHI